MTFHNPSKTIRVVSLNLLNNPVSFDKRLATFVTELETINPDVILLQEAMEGTQTFLTEKLTSLGFMFNVFSRFHGRGVRSSGNAIFSKIPFVNSKEILGDEIQGKVENPCYSIPALSAEIFFDGCPVTLISTHLCWGAGREGSRLLQAEMLSRFAEKTKKETPGMVIIMGGDFNASEHSATIQFLKGRGVVGEKLYSTYWVDAWEVHGNKNNWSTSDPHLFWNKVTATDVGSLNPNFTPERRIDYLFSYEWCYGKLGYPLNFNRFGDSYTYDENELSDHYGIFSDFVVAYEPILSEST